MRGFSVDERDSTWERDDARFRVYVFDGPDNAVTTLDIVDATVEEALESARAMSDGDKRLWALALVENDARGMRGLLWLSGLDYNDSPGTPREWRRRGQMQTRYLTALSRRGARTVLPDGRRLIRMFPEWVRGLPLWEDFTDDYRHTEESLTLPPALSAELVGWNETWLSRHEDDPEPDGWQERGHALFRQVQAELAGIAEVRPEYWREPDSA